jgi:hypothetical protein
MVVACIALIVALGGTSYAAVSMTLPHDSVGTQQLRDDAVTSVKVRDFSLRAWDFKRHSLPRGLPGPQGPPGVIGDMILREGSIAVPGNGSGNGKFVTRAVQVMCEAGETAVTGGTRWSTDANQEQMLTVYSRPVIANGQPVGWRARGGTDLPVDRVFNVEVLCAK